MNRFQKVKPQNKIAIIYIFIPSKKASFSINTNASFF